MSEIVEQLKELLLTCSRVCVDSRLVQPGDLFVALSGTCVDGADYIDMAVERGAVAVLSHRLLSSTVPVRVSDTIESDLHAICSWVYGDPWSAMVNIAITGTNGKTSVTYLLEALGQACSKTVGVLGTINYRIGETILAKEQHTTPAPPDSYRWGRQLVDQGADVCVMEASSHALQQGRLHSLPVKVAVFTNLTHDHLDYHSTMEDYLKAKKRLFDELERDTYAVIYADDPYAEEMVKNCRAQVIRYGGSEGCDLRGVKNSQGRLQVFWHNDMPYEVNHGLVGSYNDLNVLASLAVGYVLQWDVSRMQKALQDKVMIPGRLESYEFDGKLVFIDYAHTPDALANVLKTLKQEYAKHLWVVFGCGGDRDKDKRPLMGKVASDWADSIVLTSDNPRYENSHIIMQQIAAGIAVASHCLEVESREQAIIVALQQASEGDVVLIAGKGHESYQDICGVKYEYCDQKVLSNLSNVTITTL